MEGLNTVSVCVRVGIIQYIICTFDRHRQNVTLIHQTVASRGCDSDSNELTFHHY